MLNRSKLYKALPLLTLLLAACTVSNQPAIKQGFNDLTGHYNAYWYAKDKMRLVLAGLENPESENYTELLPVFPYLQKDAAKSHASDLDDIVKKGSYVVQYKEISRWTDDAYLQIGKAYLIKGEAGKAITTFQYLNAEYKSGIKEQYAVKSKKKKHRKKSHKPTSYKKAQKKKSGDKETEDNRPENSIWVHEPAYNESVLWLAQAYAASGKSKDAQAVIDFAKNDKNFAKDYDYDLYKTEALAEIQEENYSGAISSLKKAISKHKKKKDNARLYFIIGQLNEELKDFTEASNAYASVLKNHPTYQLGFQAKIKLATIAAKSTGGSTEAKEILTKLLRDRKNEEYFDRIHFQLGLMAKAENNIAEAEAEFNKSIKSNIGNAQQRGLSFLELGKIKYEEEDYRMAKFMYDSSFASLEKASDVYLVESPRYAVLKHYWEQQSIIEREDTMRALAKMDEKERNKRVAQLLKKRKEQDAANVKPIPEKSATDPMSKGLENKPGLSPMSAAIQSNWYFYNEAIREKGKKDFEKKWGKRLLGDNWRTAKTVGENTGSTNGSESAEGEEKFSPANKEEIEKFSKQIPLDAAAMLVSDGRLAEALYALGVVYKNEIRNFNKSIETFESLLNRFPENKYKPETYYQLYLLYSQKKNNSRSEFYKNVLVKDYPSSVYARYIDNPQLLNEKEEKQNALNAFYAETYDAYLKNDFDAVQSRCKQADSKFSPNTLKPQFDFLNCLALGGKKDYTAMKMALNDFILKTPDGDLRKNAQKLLLRMDDLEKIQAEALKFALAKAKEDSLKKTNVIPLSPQGKGDTVVLKSDQVVADTVKPKPAPLPSIYKSEPDSPHWFVILARDKSLNTTALKNKLLGIAAGFKEAPGLKPAVLPFADGLNYVQVKEFKDAATAKAFLQKVVDAKYVLENLKEEQFDMFVISTGNFTVLSSDKKVKTYTDWFKTNY